MLRTLWNFHVACYGYRHVLSVSLPPSTCSGGNLQQAAAAAASGAQQMGPYMGTHHFYGNMFYPAMYGPMPAFSQVKIS